MLKLFSDSVVRQDAVSLQGAVTVSAPATITMFCGSDIAGVAAFFRRLAAIQVGQITRAIGHSPARLVFVAPSKGLPRQFAPRRFT